MITFYKLKMNGNTNANMVNNKTNAIYIYINKDKGKMQNEISPEEHTTRT